MTKKQQLAPVVLMFIAASLSFLVCEELSRKPPIQETQTAQAITQQPAIATIQPEASAPKNFAQKIAQKISHVVHSTARSAELMETSTAQRESGLQTVQPETVSANELDEAALHGPVDLSLVPGVIVLPKKQEPLASAGLYDKRTHQKL